MRFSGGFTLIEIMIALLIFAIISVITSTVLYTVFDTRDRTNQHADRLAELQLALVVLERDIEQAVARPITIDLTQQQAPLVGSQNRLALTRAGVVNPLSLEKRSSLKRIAYLLDDGRLIRRSWQTLDRQSQAPYQDRTLLNKCAGLQFAFLNDKGQMLSVWDPPVRSKKPATMPRAVQITLRLDDWGEMSLLYPINVGFYVNKDLK